MLPNHAQQSTGGEREEEAGSISLVLRALQPARPPTLTPAPSTHGAPGRNLLEETKATLVVQMPGWTGLANARVTIFGDIVQLPADMQVRAQKCRWLRVVRRAGRSLQCDLPSSTGRRPADWSFTAGLKPAVPQGPLSTGWLRVRLTPAGIGYCAAHAPSAHTSCTPPHPPAVG